ncbi:MAG: tripartite tricarboxylate transporter substrate binding protein [Acetobacteraceae bacterium]|nr:tripartite tricarboxylate transporter substrate binding protein [Acetobacteraceae bacterium]
MRSPVTRRALGRALAAAPLLAAPALAQAPWPQRPVRIVVPYSAGGPSDVVARLLAPGWAAALNQNVVVDNRPGAGGVIGTEHVARVNDGHTFLLADAPFTIAPAVQERMPYDAANEFAPVTLLGAGTMILLVHQAFPARGVSELLAAARARPEAVSFGGSGPGSLSHLLPEWLGQLGGVRFANVAYRGAAPALQDAAAGQINAVFGGLTGSLPTMQTGAVRAIGVAAEQRMPELPDVPTLREGGVDLVAANWFGILAPAATPAPVRERLAEITAAFIANPDMRQRLAGAGLEPRPTGTAPFSQLLTVEFARWAAVARAAGVRVS